jgi:hypothetical protein
VPPTFAIAIRVPRPSTATIAPAGIPLVLMYFDVALRDFGLMLGALALARLSEEFAEGAA